MEDKEMRLLLAKQHSELRGLIFGLMRTVRVVIDSAFDPKALHVAIDQSLDGFIATASVSLLSEEQRKGVKEVQAYMAKTAPQT